ncbi:MAG TPA: 3-isopropylmalate dehydratase large subunit [Planctomycetota bacterium]|nr:3-isopropylmalate dehydratase large subunit [Planctomycetota bacterium]HRR80504.1 3-isopropylmalate dehydratase large subunit [Planctomycetota bacterium]HRT94904.1 3-isopropylmalate dehydratase large subunit [Planctomycetota bacterium]
MGMTITEKIIAAHVGKDVVRPGEFHFVPVDVVMANDITAPLAIECFERTGATRVFDPERIILIPDHYVPNKDIKAAEQAKVLRAFARQHKLPFYYEVGRACVCHSLVPDEGHCVAGDVMVGADSHSCTNGALGAFATGMGSTDVGVIFALGQTWLKVPQSLKFVYHGQPRNPWVGGKDYILATIGRIGVAGALYCAMEFTGEAIEALPMHGRLTMCNMAIEAGGKSGIIAFDDKTAAFLEGRARRPPRVYASDPDAAYRETHEFDVTSLEPQVACPHLPSNVKPVSELRHVRIDQAFIGSCTNGRYEDIAQAAAVIKGRKVHRDVRLIVIPSSLEGYRRCIAEGLDEVFVEAGGVFSTPTCGPCLGGHMGVLAAGETCVSTTNRNFEGRMGHLKSFVYLANPAVAAASAVLGRIGSPDEL